MKENISASKESDVQQETNKKRKPDMDAQAVSQAFSVALTEVNSKISYTEPVNMPLFWKKFKKELGRDAADIEPIDALKEDLLRRAQEIIKKSEKATELDASLKGVKSKRDVLYRKIHNDVLDGGAQAEVAEAENNMYASRDLLQEKGIPQKVLKSSEALREYVAEKQEEIKLMKKEYTELEARAPKSWISKLFSSALVEQIQKKKDELAKKKLEFKALKQAADTYIDSPTIIKDKTNAMHESISSAISEHPQMRVLETEISELESMASKLNSAIDKMLIEFQELYHISNTGTTYTDDWPDWKLNDKATVDSDWLGSYFGLKPRTGGTNRQKILSHVDETIEYAVLDGDIQE